MRPRGAKRELKPYSELAHEFYFIDRVTLGSHTENGIETLRGSIFIAAHLSNRAESGPKTMILKIAL